MQPASGGALFGNHCPSPSPLQCLGRCAVFRRGGPDHRCGMRPNPITLVPSGMGCCGCAGVSTWAWRACGAGRLTTRPTAQSWRSGPTRPLSAKEECARNAVPSDIGSPVRSSTLPEKLLGKDGSEGHSGAWEMGELGGAAAFQRRLSWVTPSHTTGWFTLGFLALLLGESCWGLHPLLNNLAFQLWLQPTSHK